MILFLSRVVINACSSGCVSGYIYCTYLGVCTVNRETATVAYGVAKAGRTRYSAGAVASLTTVENLA